MKPETLEMNGNQFMKVIPVYVRERKTKGN